MRARRLSLFSLIAATIAACGEPPTMPDAQSPAPVPPSSSPPLDLAEARAEIPALSPSPPPLEARRPPWLGQPVTDLIVFSSNRRGGTGRGFDIYFYDPAADTVFSPVAVNTEGDELCPLLIDNNRRLVYNSNGGRGDFDVLLFDMRTQEIDTLPTLNTPADEIGPSLDDAGRLIAYTRVVDGVARLHLFDLTTGIDLVPAVLRRFEASVIAPRISGDGTQVAFGAEVGETGLDVFIYDIPSASLWTPPFVNTPHNEGNPAFGPDGKRLAFVTDRRGDNDIFLADLTTGFVDTLPLANSQGSEDDPYLFGNSLLYESTRDGTRRFLVYDLEHHVVDTLPVAHEPGADDQ